MNDDDVDDQDFDHGGHCVSDKSWNCNNASSQKKYNMFWAMVEKSFAWHS